MVESRTLVDWDVKWVSPISTHSSFDKEKFSKKKIQQKYLWYFDGFLITRNYYTRITRWKWFFRFVYLSIIIYYLTSLRSLVLTGAISPIGLVAIFPRLRMTCLVGDEGIFNKIEIYENFFRTDGEWLLELWGKVEIIILNNEEFECCWKQTSERLENLKWSTANTIRDFP